MLTAGDVVELDLDSLGLRLNCSCLPRSVYVSAMLDPVDENDHIFVVNLIDDAVVTASGRMEAFQFPEQRLAQASWVSRDGTKDGCQGCFAYLRR